MKAGLTTLLCLLLAGCMINQAAIQRAVEETLQAGYSAPEGSEPVFMEPPVAAVNKIIEYTSSFWDEGTYHNYDNPEFLVDRSIKLTPARDDVLNKISEKWCLGISYLGFASNTGEFKEFFDVYLLILSEDSWSMEFPSLSNVLSKPRWLIYNERWEECINSF